MSTPVLFRQDPLALLNQPVSLNTKLEALRQAMRQTLPFIDRVAVALHEPESGLLKTFIASTEGQNQLVHYQADIDCAPALLEVAQRCQPRVVNNLKIFSQGEHEHTQRVEQSGFRSSYTFPIFSSEHLTGFVFFNSFQANVFDEAALRQLDPYAHLIAQIVLNALMTSHTMLAAFRSTSGLVHEKDPETGAHLERMSRYSRLIARHLALTGQAVLNDEYIEQVFIFSPLHDVGKLGIRDSVLRKEGPLDSTEKLEMRQHTLIGRRIVDMISTQFGFGVEEHIDVLRHIAEHHHETLDGKGYPHGLIGEQISLEARIVAVADIFDALTSARPYKQAWSNEQAFETLQRLAQDKLDDACVSALIANIPAILEIQSQFVDPQEVRHDRPTA